MIWYTIEQAAERVSVRPGTIYRWIRDQDLPVVTHDLVPGVKFVREEDLLGAYRTVRARQGGGTRFRTRHADNPAGQRGSVLPSPQHRRGAASGAQPTPGEAPR